MKRESNKLINMRDSEKEGREDVEKIREDTERDIESILERGGRPSHPVPRTPVPKSVKERVWAIHIGMDKAEGKCFAGCGRTIHMMDFEVGHNKAVSKGGSNRLDNLRPICKKCNRSMRTRSIEEFKREHFSKSKGRQVKSLRTVPQGDIENYFE